MNTVPALLMTLSLLLWPALSSAVEIYKSADAEGNVTYSDRPAVSSTPLSLDPGGDGSDAADMSATTAPPDLPAEDQPPCSQDGELWTPGYWSWNGAEYDWVPGVWLLPPIVGAFWTPGYWAYAGTLYVFHRGYWGAHVGYYGGINYGFGYEGRGTRGGRWVGKVFAYNRSVNNVNPKDFRHVYDEPLISHEGPSRVSYNGGRRGTDSVATPQERLAAQSRLSSRVQRIDLKPDPGATPTMPLSAPQAAPAAKPVVSRAPPAPTPRRTVANTRSQPQAPVSAAVRPATTTPKASRARPEPAIRSMLIK